MKKSSLFLGAVLLSVVAGSGNTGATFLNAPHNKANSVDCVDCHEYPFEQWTGYVPDPGNADDTIRNFVCLRCHNGSQAGIPGKKTHSSLNLSTGHGNWTVQCVDCHDPHFQAQVDYFATDASSLYLVRGSYVANGISVTTTDPLNPETTTFSTIAYSGINALAGWASPATWAAKTGAGRGLILVADTARPYDTFEVTAADETTVTVSGDLRNVTLGSQFGLVYGQLVRGKVSSAGVKKTVKFFNPQGGHVDTVNATPQGICQVCHTLTRNWLADGTVTNNPAATDHNTGVDCTTCHLTADGFKAGNTDHTVAASSGNVPIQQTAACASCHTYTDPVADIHKSNCSYCHTSPPALKAGIAANTCAGCHPSRDPNAHVSDHNLTAYDTAPVLDCGGCHGAGLNINTFHVGRTVVRGSVGSAAVGTVIDCATCHNSSVQLVADAVAKGRSSNPAAATVYCADCHGSRPADHPNDTMPAHSWLLKSATSCETCHDPNGTADIVAGIHKNNCAACHTLPSYTVLRTGTKGDAALHGAVGQGNTSSCTVCHAPAVYPANTFHHATANAQSGNCTFCHDGNAAADHATLVADYANCTLCHAANAGSAAGAPVDAANNRIHDGCTTCHKTDGSLKGLVDLSRNIVIAMPAGTAASNDGGGTCAACHGEYFANHTAADHTARVADSANCNLCHTATAGSASTVPVNAADNKVHDACTSCHNADGSLRAVTAPGGSAPIVAGDCNACHGAYFPNHANANHLTRVAPLAECVTCHTATAGTATTVPVNAADAKVHDACTSCHNGDGSLRAVTAPGGSAAIAAGDCAACHGSSYFPQHGHHNGATNDVSYNATVDTSQTTPTGCAVCHTDYDTANSTSLGLSTWQTILVEHDLDGVKDGSTNACARCHSYTGAKSAPLAAVQNAIASGNPATCATCHTDKVPNTNHGGHQPTDFAWAGNCADCHGAVTDSVIGIVHGNGCSFCHVDAANGNYTRKAGDATFGVDGDATLAIDRTATCLTCHPNAGNKTGGATIHHVSRNGYATAGNCAACHGTSGHQGDHSTFVGQYVNCQLCHGSAAGSATGVPVSTSDNKVHDVCTSCHNTDGSLRTVTAPGGSAPIVAGTCAGCHGEYFPNHTNASHTTRVADSANCNSCHSATAGTLTTVPVSPADNKVHDTCGSCHNTNGSLRAVTAPGGSAPIASGNCNACHGQYFASHSNANHSTRVAGLAECTSCHTATAGTATTVPVNPADSKVHDACSTCHNLTDGSLRAAYGRASDMIAGGANCADCHGFFQDHLHHDTVPPSDVTYNPATDTSQTNMAPCASCHDDSGNGFSSFADIVLEHDVRDGVKDGIGACQICHAYAGDRSAPLAAVQGAISSGSPATCATCHTDKVPNVNHGGHAPTDFGWGGTCASCHSGASVVTDVHGGKCDLCHVNASGGNYARKAATDGDATRVDGVVNTRTNSTCVTCHNGTTYPAGSIHHDTAKAANNNCTDCHASSNHATTVANVTPCSKCHDLTNGTATGAPVSLTDPMVHDGCVTCHTFDANKRGILRNFTNQKGVNGTGSLPNGGTIGGTDGGGTCKVCHTGLATTASNFHHAITHGSGYAAVGQCEHCHSDPRNTWSPTRPGDANSTGTAITGAGTLNPTQLACVNCHGAFGGGNLTITKYTRTNYTNLATDWTRATVHTIPNTANQINNWGICFDCHNNPNNATSPQVNLWHARPDKNGGATWALGTTRYQRSRCYGDEARYAAGRAYDGSGGSSASAVSSNLGAFNIFRANYYIASGKPGNSTNCSSVRSEYDAKPTATPNFVRMTIPAVIHNGNLANQQVPVFGSKTANTGTASPAADDVKVTQASWNGTSLVVNATNSMGCSAMTVQYGATNQVMSGAGTCTATINGANYPAAGTTVNVVTSNSDGISVYGYRITDNATPIPAAAGNDNLTASANGVTNLDVLANDSGTAIAITGVTQPNRGSVAIAGGGASINYTGNGTGGSTSFTYTIQGSTGGPSTGTVNLTVAANQPPTVTNDAYTVSINSTTSLNVLANDSDSDGPNALTVSAVGTPSCGSVVNNTSNVSYTAPATGGSCTFSYTAFDGINSVNGTVTVTVNSITPFADWTETFTGAADATLFTAQSLGSQWTVGSSNASANCWFTDTNTTASGGTGLTAGNPAPYVYLEASTSSSPSCSYNAGDQFWLESPNLAANSYSFILSFDWNYESTQTSGRTIRVYYRNGTGGTWTQLGTPIATARRGTTAAWTSSGNINLGSVLNQAGSRVRIHVTADTNNYANDVVFDNIRIDGTP
ncbi:MAG: cytochrome c3 family protein [Thermodesulfobacteriota bacterium]